MKVYFCVVHIVLTTVAHVFSSVFCEISKNTFSYKAPLVPAAATIVTKSVKLDLQGIKLTFEIAYNQNYFNFNYQQVTN